MKTDRQLQQDVLDELQWEPAVEASAIGVEATDGIVTLAGHVASFAQKWAAEAAAQRVAGVKGVAVEIDVRLPDSNRRTDADLAQAVATALEWNSSVPKDGVKIAVSHGVVHLSGEVDWAFQRVAAVAAVRNLVGVRGVTDQLAIKPHPIDARGVRHKIQAALQRQAQIDAKAITIDIDGNRVTLGGTVDSWSEKTAARNAAWSTPGVQSVVDNLSVAD